MLRRKRTVIKSSRSLLPRWKKWLPKKKLLRSESNYRRSWKRRGGRRLRREGSFEALNIWLVLQCRNIKPRGMKWLLRFQCLSAVSPIEVGGWSKLIWSVSSKFSNNHTDVGHKISSMILKTTGGNVPERRINTSSAYSTNKGILILTQQTWATDAYSSLDTFKRHTHNDILIISIFIFKVSTVLATIWQNSSNEIFPSPSLSASIIVLSTIYS